MKVCGRIPIFAVIAMLLATLFAPPLPIFCKTVSDPCLGLFGIGSKPPCEPKEPARRVRRLSDKELDRRSCVLSYPWPPEVLFSSQWSKNPHLAIDRISAARMKQIRSAVNQMLDHAREPIVAPDPQMRMWFEHHSKRVKDSLDVEQTRLYGDLLYVQKLTDEGQYSKVITEVARLKRSGRVKAGRASVDSGDHCSYFSRQNIRNLIILRQYQAEARVATKTPKEACRLLANLLDDYDLLTGYVDNMKEAAFDVVAARVVELIYSRLSEPFWSRTAALDGIPQLAGWGQSGNELCLFVKGKNGTHGVSYGLRKTTRLRPSKAAERFRSICHAEMRSATTNAMVMFNVLSSGASYEVTIAGKKILVSTKELARLKRGQPLPPSHPLTLALNSVGDRAKVMYSNPLMQKNGQPFRDADMFTCTLQRAYPKHLICRDPLSAATARRAEALRSFAIRGPSDICAILVAKSFGVREGGEIENLRANLSKAGIQVLDPTESSSPDWHGGTGKGLIVVTGHSDKRLAEFVRFLGNAGYLTDNYVVFNSCGTALTRQMVCEMNQNYGAAAVLSYHGTISATQVEPFLNDLAKEISQLKAGAQFHDIINRGLSRHHLSATWTISRNIDDNPFHNKEVVACWNSR